MRVTPKLYLKLMSEKKQLKYDRAYLRIAKEWGKLSYCKRKQVGALIVKDKMIISDGYNGTPAGFDNCCENESGDTNWYVLHAEANAILKVAKSTNNCKGATLYLTLSPCRDCSKLVIQSGITRVVFIDGYKDSSGIDFLKTSTGYAEKGASVEAVQLFRKHLPESVHIKASGGIRDYETAKQMIQAGATRIGCSAGVAIVSGAKTEHLKSNY